jgi:hypothetical protein
MNEHPILFQSEMVRAALADRKHQTRRVIKLPSWSTGDWADFELDDEGQPMTICKDTTCLAPIRCPYGQPGDRLWVKETFAMSPKCETGHDPDVIYKATFEDWQGPIDRWRPSIFMPRCFSRITLEVLKIRVEKLQDITEADAIAEGIPPFLPSPPKIPVMQYITLWQSINWKRGFGWDTNPWVWVVEFRRLP